MKGYRFGVAWIAMNDEPADLNMNNVSGYVSTLLLADLFGKPADRVAEAVVLYRIKKANENPQECTGPCIAALMPGEVCEECGRVAEEEKEG